MIRSVHLEASANPVSDDCRLVVFARYPRVHQVKTRLAATLGAGATLRFYSSCLRLVLETMSEVAARREVFFDGCSSGEALELLRAWQCSRDWTARLQASGDLGQRLKVAVREVWSTGTRVVFLGADAPSLPVSRVEEAFRRLQQARVVLGPAEDGGYYLIGLNEPCDAAFSNIDWGTDRVLAQTLERLQGERIHLLEPWFDVDDELGWRRLLEDREVRARLEALGGID